MFLVQAILILSISWTFHTLVKTGWTCRDKLLRKNGKYFQVYLFHLDKKFFEKVLDVLFKRQKEESLKILLIKKRKGWVFVSIQKPYLFTL